MTDIRMAVIYYSTYGTNHRMAEIATEAIRETGAEVRLRKVRETAPREVIEAQEAWKKQIEKTEHIPTAKPEDMEWADGYLFSTPTRYGGAASQMRSFIDTLGPLWMEGKLANKTASVMTSAQNPHGGQETTLLTMYVTFSHWGTILVPPGYTDQSVFDSGGNPYGASITASEDAVTKADEAVIRHQARRLVDITRQLKGVGTPEEALVGV